METKTKRTPKIAKRAKPAPAPKQLPPPPAFANQASGVAEPELGPDENGSPETLERLPRETYDGETAFRLYLREVAQTKLLTPKEEIALAKKIKKGDEQARELMIRANLRLVVKIAREFEDYGLPLLDLINEGNIGLMKAVERFDPAKGAKLSTYAAWWIKQAIRRALANQSKTIRLPVHVGDKLLHIRRAASKMQMILGREASDEELAEELGMTAARIASLRNAASRPASLDAPLGEDETNRYSDIVEDERTSTPYEQLEDRTTTDMLHEMIQELPAREAAILRHRFGLEGDNEKTLEEIGEKFGVTRERIRQIQNIALAKLRRMIEKRESARVAA